MELPENPTQIQLLTQKIDQLLDSQENLITQIQQLQTNNQQLQEKIQHLEQSQSASLSEFLKQLADTLNSNKSSSLKESLEKLTSALLQVGFEVQEQRNSQVSLNNSIMRVLTAQDVMSLLNQTPTPISNNSQPQIP